MTDQQQYALESVSFHGDTIFVVDHNGEPMTSMRPIIENMGIDWPTQNKKLSEESARWNYRHIPTVPKRIDGGVYICQHLSRNLPTKLKGGCVYISTQFPGDQQRRSQPSTLSQEATA